MHRIRTKIRPEKTITVDEAEFTDLTRHGLVLDTAATTDEGARRAAERQAAADEKKEG